MNNLEEQAKEIAKEIRIFCQVVKDDRNSKDSKEYIEREVSKKLIDFANSLTPQPIKVDAERRTRAKEFYEKNKLISDSIISHMTAFADEECFEQSEFIKRQKEKEVNANNLIEELLKKESQLKSKVKELEEGLNKLLNQLGNEHVTEEFCEPIIEECKQLLKH